MCNGVPVTPSIKSNQPVNTSTELIQVLCWSELIWSKDIQSVSHWAKEEREREKVKSLSRGTCTGVCSVLFLSWELDSCPVQWEAAHDEMQLSNKRTLLHKTHSMISKIDSSAEKRGRGQKCERERERERVSLDSFALCFLKGSQKMDSSFQQRTSDSGTWPGPYCFILLTWLLTVVVVVIVALVLVDWLMVLLLISCILTETPTFLYTFSFFLSFFLSLSLSLCICYNKLCYVTFRNVLKISFLNFFFFLFL